MIVVDASVTCKLFLPKEQDYLKADKIFGKHLRGLEEITVPNLLLYEVANTLSTKNQIPSTQITRSLDKLEAYELMIFDPSIAFLNQVVDFSRKYKVSVYDAAYAVLAREKKCDLITADDKFVQQVALPFVKSLSNYPEV